LSVPYREIRQRGVISQDRNSKPLNDLIPDTLPNLTTRIYRAITKRSLERFLPFTKLELL